MKYTLRFLCLVASIIIFSAGTVSYAAGTYTPGDSATSASGTFTAGSSVFLGGNSTSSETDGKYDVYLDSYLYDHMTTNARPYNTYTYLQAYTTSHVVAGTQASFSLAGYGYSYSYYSGYGGAGQPYCLKGSSSNSNLGAYVHAKWQA